MVDPDRESPYLSVPWLEPSRYLLGLRGGGSGWDRVIFGCGSVVHEALIWQYDEMEYSRGSAIDGRHLVLLYSALNHQG